MLLKTKEKSMEHSRNNNAVPVPEQTGNGEKMGGKHSKKAGMLTKPKQTEVLVEVENEMEQAMADADGINLTVNASDDEFQEDDAQSGYRQSSNEEDEDEDSEKEEGEAENSEIDEEVMPPSNCNWDNFDEVASMGSSEVQFNYRRLQPTINMAATVNSEEDAVKFLSSNPYLGNLFKKMIKEGIQEESKKQRKGNEIVAIPNESNKQCDNATPIKTPIERQPVMMKSPSDTTIYAPALTKLPSNDGNASEIMDRISNFVEEI